MPINAIVIRTSWLYSEYGNNFVKTMLRLGRERDELKVVSDQMGSPTYATDLADVILEIIKHKKFRYLGQTMQIYHYSSEEEISWYEFAKEIFKIAKIDCKVNPINTEQFPTLAKRPRNTYLYSSKVTKAYSIKGLFWKSSLNRCLIQIID